MAGVALLAQSALVNVIVRMALDTFQGRLVEGQCRVALRTADDTMQSQQRVLRQVVVEHNVGRPGALSVAGFAAAGELSAMRVLAAMAARTVLREFLLCDHPGMTRITIDLGVCPDQREVRLFRVIVSDGLPFLVVVAVIALFTETPGVSIIGLVAAIAVLGDLVLVVATAVASYTVNIRVHTQQRIACLLQVVILRRLPLVGDMTLTAVAAARATMLIVGRVTADAGLRCLFVMATDMTGIASHGPMGARQPEARFVMIEFPTSPTRRTVALAAGLAELPMVCVVALVAIDAVSCNFAPRHTGLVAGVAGERGMRALERKVGQVMIELPTAQVHDVGLATLVLRVTGTALTGAGVGHTSVVAVMLPQVRGDLFMAIQTQ